MELSFRVPEIAGAAATNPELGGAPGRLAPGRFWGEEWEGGLPDTAGLWPELDPAGSSLTPLNKHTKTLARPVIVIEG